MKTIYQHLSLSIFWYSSIWGCNKTNWTKFQTVDPKLINIDFLKKGLGVASPSYFVYDFWRRCLSCYILLTSQIHFLIVFTFWDTEQYMYCNWLWRHLSKQAVSLHDQKVKKKNLNILREKHFSSFLKVFQLLEIYSDWRVHL